MKNKLTKFAAVLVPPMLYGSINLFFFIAQNKLIFNPRRLTKEQRQLQFLRGDRQINRKVFRITWQKMGDSHIYEAFLSFPASGKVQADLEGLSNDEKIKKVVSTLPEDYKIAVYFGGAKEDVIEQLGALKDWEKCIWITYNYPNYGESKTGKSTGITQELILNSADDFMFFLNNQSWFDPQRTTLIGRSLGTGVVSHILYGFRTFKRALLITPYDSILEVAKNMYPWLPVSKLLKTTFRSKEWLQNWRSDVSLKVLLSEYDETVPHKHSKELYDTWGGIKEMQVVMGCDHGSIIEVEETWKTMYQYVLNKDA